MKKLTLLTTLCGVLCCYACNDSSDGDGRMQLTLDVETATVPTGELTLTKASPSATDLSSYHVTLEGAGSKELSFPADGIITGLKEGNYSVTVSSHRQLPAPAFSSPYYSGNQEVYVPDGETALSTVKLKQLNAGVFFTYTRSLLASDLDYTPTVTHADGTLVYSGDNLESTGYFPVGNVKIEVPGMNLSREVSLAAADLYKVTLDYDPGNDGISITIDFIVVEEPTDTDSFLIGISLLD